MSKYPALSIWMQDASPKHPLKELDFPDGCLAAFDEILALIEGAQPLRIARKRQVFRRMTQVRELLEQRAELTAASLLVRAGVPFEFAAARPDLVLSEARCGIEVTTRALDDQRALVDLLQAALTGQDLRVVLTFDGRPLKLGETSLDGIVDGVTASIKNGCSAFRFDDIGLTVGVTAGVGLSDAAVTVVSGAVTGSELTGYMAEAEREIANTIAKKRPQASEMPTILLIDIGRLGEAWLRPGHFWAKPLERLLEGEPFAGLALMRSTLTAALPMELTIVTGDETDIFEGPLAAISGALGLVAVPMGGDAS